MKTILFAVLAISLAPGAAELHAATYTQGRVASMHSVPCGRQTKKQQLCEQYLIRTDKLDYRIRQEKAKQVNLLPVGQAVYFRVKKNRMEIKGYTLNGKRINNQEYIVVSERQSAEGAGQGMP